VIAIERCLSGEFIMSNVYLPRDQYSRVQKVLLKGREKYGSAAVERISHAFAMIAGLAPAAAAESPLQRPDEFLYPGLSARPWHDVAKYGFSRNVEASADLIGRDLENVLRASDGFQPYRVDEIVPRGRWEAFYFRIGTTWFDENRKLCPHTFCVLESVPRLAEIAVFSALAPGTHLVPHCGAWNCKITFHLALVIPENCGLRVANETRAWQPGKLVAFDDTFEHEAWNNSDQPRYVLLFDVWHPDLSDVEVELLEQLREHAGIHDGSYTVGQARVDRSRYQESVRSKDKGISSRTETTIRLAEDLTGRMGKIDPRSEQAAIVKHGDGAHSPAVAAKPLPDIDASTNTIFTGDREVEILLTCNAPKIVVLGNVLSDEECDALAKYCEPRLERSQVVADAAGNIRVHESRTSRSAGLRRGETAIIARIEARLAALARWPEERGEGLQVLRYDHGEEYRPHHDWIPDLPGVRKHMDVGGQRLATFVLYLSKVDSGGSTSFPAIGLEVAPRKGGAVFFVNTDSQYVPDQLTLHAGSPVVRGVKIVANKWLRERAC
jgi:prolyl 4-hydroxylase